MDRKFLFWIFALALNAALFLPQTANSTQAAVFVITHDSYKETAKDFEWKFHGVGNEATPITTVFAPPAAQRVFWDLSGNYTDVVDPNDPDTANDDFSIKSLHKRGPHGETDQPTVFFFIKDVPLLADTKGAATNLPIFKSAGSGTHNNEHFDTYSLFYSTNGAPAAGRRIDFIITGDHVIPEPPAFLLLASGLVGLFGTRKIRRVV